MASWSFRNKARVVAPTSLLLIALFSSSAFAMKYKYPADVKSLSTDNSYLRRSPAPDYWKLDGFLVKQFTNSACSVAAVTIVLNGARGTTALEQSETLLTQKTVLKTTDLGEWTAATATDGGGVSLKLLESYAQAALIKHGFINAKVERVSMAQNNGTIDIAQFRKDLVENERSLRDSIVVNFDQSYVMENSDPVGHFASVGAYDAATDRVLILDPDKDWYEPYWVPTRKLFEAMGTTRGYLKFIF